jgi:hypothetical protein
VKTTPKLERKEGLKRGQKGLKKDPKRTKKIDFGSFFRVFGRVFWGKYADAKRVKWHLHQIHGSFFEKCALEERFWRDFLGGKSVLKKWVRRGIRAGARRAGWVVLIWRALSGTSMQ